MQEYHAALEAFHARDTEIVAISPMTPERTEALAEKLQLGFPLLSDWGSAYARSLGLLFEIGPEVREIYRAKGLNLSDFNGDENWELPVPAVFLADGERKILYAWTEPDYTRRPDPEELLAALDERR